MSTSIFQLLAVSLVVMGLSHTLTREKIGEPIRRRLGTRDTWLGYLGSCPYCASHWIAFVIVPLTGTYAIAVDARLGFFSLPLRWFLSSVLVAMIAAFYRVLFYFVDETQGLVRRQQKTTDEELETRRALRERLQESAGNGAKAPAKEEQIPHP